MITPEQAREALLLLYIPQGLADCELARLLPETRDTGDPLARAQAVRGKLLDAIAALRSNLRSGLPASASRAYDCLRLRYVSGFSVEEVARRLSLSERQAYRDLRFAEEQLCYLLQPGPAPQLDQVPTDSERQADDVLSEEIRALAHKPEPVHLVELVRSAIDTVSRLAERQGVSVQLMAPRKNIMVTATPAVLREVLTQVLSCLLQSQPDETINVALEGDDKVATIIIPMRRPEELSKRDLLQSALRVADVQGVEHELAASAGGLTLRLRVPSAKRRRVAIVEDNPGACALYERYLANSEWEPVTVPHPRLAVDITASRQVEAVILDIMMAEADGWDVLQALKLNPRTSAVPVIVCSVVNDPELGMALGAAAYLTKPISRRDLLKSLRQLAQQRTPAVGDVNTPGSVQEAPPR
ncbi:MAG: response regulator [Anaerolineae bacterium]|nr:response regulator [Anaerolineae bacterium]